MFTAAYVMTSGTLLMQVWCVNSWDLMDQKVITLMKLLRFSRADYRAVHCGNIEC